MLVKIYNNYYINLCALISSSDTIAQYCTNLFSGPGVLAKIALKAGAEKGRDGKGSIFLWAAGTGGQYSDNCNCDGYSTSIYTMSVTAVSDSGNIPWYTETCPSIIATTYGIGTKSERKLVTTDLRFGCTDQFHGGTSSSAPIAAGLIALALEANPGKGLLIIYVMPCGPKTKKDKYIVVSRGASQLGGLF